MWRRVDLVILSVQLVYGYFRIVVLYLVKKRFVFLSFKEVINCSLYLLYGHLNIIISLLSVNRRSNYLH